MTVAAALIALALVFADGETAASRRERRVTPAARIAPAPVPRDLPLLPSSPRREVGTPDRHVDRAGVRSLLFHRKFPQLTRSLERFQAAFEKDPTCEDWPADAAEALGTGEPELGPLLDAWIASAPRSFAPRLARGVFWVNVGLLRRGDPGAKESREDLEAMREAFASARRDLDRAIALRPRLVAALVKLEVLGIASSDRPTIEDAHRRAVAACPTCFAPRAAFVGTLGPGAGGGFAEMEEYAASLPTKDAPRLAFLSGYAALERASSLEAARDLRGASDTLDHVVALGAHAPFYWRRGRFRLRSDLGSAQADLERAHELAPGEPGIVVSLARVHELASRWEDAARWLRTALRMDPLDPKARRWLPEILRGLGEEAEKLAAAGQTTDALRLVDAALDLSPGAKDLSARREALLGGDAAPNAEALAALEQGYRERPDDLETLRRLDRALASRGDRTRAVALWSAHLRRHPKDGRAYLERSGAHARLGDAREARADAERACELDLSEGCARARDAGR